MNKELNEKILKIIMEVMAIVIIALYAFSLTPKTFQNDTFYTIKIGEHIQNNVQDPKKLLPWNEGLYSPDPFSYHEDLQYTYPHWLYDLITYKIYCINGFKSVYVATCILSIILGLSIYYVNRRLNKSLSISTIITLASLYCLKGFIAARAQLVTFILFVFSIYCIEKFISTKKIRYAITLIIIPILIANVHSAVWPFYFVLYLPYLVEYIITCIATINYKLLFNKMSLKLKKKKIGKIQYDLEKNKIEKLQMQHDNFIRKRLKRSYKLNIVHNKNIKWLFLIVIICLFTGLLTPIKDMPYTYIVRTMQGNTTAIINEHLPLTLVKNTEVMTILVMIFGILIFTRTKIKLRDFFMLLGLITLSFMSQRQVSMLVLIGNFIMVRLICDWLSNINKKYVKKIKYFYVELLIMVIVVLYINLISLENIKHKSKNEFVDYTSYPVAATNYIKADLIPAVGVENLRIYNDYNYGSYLLFKEIPVFIDSRCDLYTPEFNGVKDESGNYVGRDIFTDFLDISGLSVDYEKEFKKYNITHVITYSNSKLKSAIEKDKNYRLLYSDDYFVIYERSVANK